MNLSNIWKVIYNNKEKILTGLGLTCLVAATPVAVINTVKATKTVAHFKRTHGWDPEDKLDAKTLIKLCWKDYIPTAMLLLGGGGCTAGGLYFAGQITTSYKIGYDIATQQLTDHLAAEANLLGKKSEEKIKDAIAETKLDSNPASITNVCHNPTKPDTSLVYEPLTDRYFRSDYNTLEHDWNILMNQMLNDDYISLNDWFETCGLETAGLGDFVGWNTTKGLVELDIVAKVADTGEPCLMLDYSVQPFPNFDKYLL